MTFERFDKMMDLLSMEVKQHFVPRSEFHSLEIKLSEANIKIVKLETQLESKQALSISTPEQTSQSQPLVLAQKPAKRDIETQTDTISGIDICCQTDPPNVIHKTIQIVTNGDQNKTFQNQEKTKIKNEPEVAVLNLPDSKTKSKKRKRSKSKSKISESSSSVTSLNESQDINENVGQYQCDLCETISKLKTNLVSPAQPFICEPCQETYKAAISSCLCKGVMNTVIKTMISCEICQSWYHENCVGMSESDDEFFCNKCTEADMNYLCRTLTNDDYRFLDIEFTRLRNGKNSWPLKIRTCDGHRNEWKISQKIFCRSYRNFREIRDEMFEMIWEFKENLQNDSSQTKCCEIVEFKFSVLVRDFIRNAKIIKSKVIIEKMIDYRTAEEIEILL